MLMTGQDAGSTVSKEIVKNPLDKSPIICYNTHVIKSKGANHNGSQNYGCPRSPRCSVLLCGRACHTDRAGKGKLVTLLPLVRSGAVQHPQHLPHALRRVWVHSLSEPFFRWRAHEGVRAPFRITHHYTTSRMICQGVKRKNFSRK